MNEQHSTSQPPNAGATFESMGLHQMSLDILRKHAISTPSPIQAQAIPYVCSGNDIIGIAQTGTGKTLAFVLPMMQRLMQQPGRALILIPTRELAQQVDEVCRWFTQSGRVRSEVVIGGASMGKQIAGLKRQPAIIIATPGRLLDHLKQGTVKLRDVSYLVLDEADRMFDMGFMPQIQQIFKHIPSVEQRQTVLFSATMPDAIAQIVRNHMRAPTRIEIAPTGTTVEGVQQEMIVIEKAQQYPALISVMRGLQGAVLIFTRTKHQAKRLTQKLRDEGYRAEELHSNRSQAQRERAVAAIQTKRSQILVATDIAARGIDISHLAAVINYELPQNPEDYVHRIGRTARAGRTGRAITFVFSDQGDEIRRIQKFIRMPIEQIHLENIPSAQLSQAVHGGRRGGPQRNRPPRSRKFRFARHR